MIKFEYRVKYIPLYRTDQILTTKLSTNSLETRPEKKQKKS